MAKVVSFFTKKELREINEPTKTNVDPDVECAKCGMYKKSRSPKMGVTGDGRLNALILAEASGSNEDKSNIQLIGKVGQFLRKRIKARGYDLEKDFYKVNAIQCWPHDSKGSNRTPTSQEITHCRPRLFDTIKKVQPRFIIPMGGVAMEALLGGVFKDLKITRWRGLCIPDRELQAYIIPMYHPSAASRNEDDLNFMAEYDRDLDKMLRWVANMPDIEFENEEPYVTCLYDYPDVKNFLELVLKEKPKEVVIDYETNCLKPYIRGARIAAISIGWGEEAWAFPYQYRDHFSSTELSHIRELYKKILGEIGIKKVSQNVHFEINWSRVMFDAPVDPWVWDTMLAAHVIDNRRDFCSLEMQSYVNFGVRPYDDHIKPYLKSKGKNPFNRVMELDLEDLLTYNGLDNIYPQKLKKKQMRYFAQNKKQGRAYKFFFEGTKSCAKLSYNGVNADEEYYHRTWNKLDDKINRTEKAVLNCEEAKRFEKAEGRAIGIKKEVSSNDLRKLLFDIEGHQATGYTKKALMESTDIEALTKISTPLTRLVLKRRKYVKLLGYIEQYIRECHDGVVHADFPLHIPRSFRSSSKSPNLTNVPKRDKEGKRLVRSGIKPSRGNRLGEIDFSGMEVATGCCYHKDPQMIKYLTDPKSDMHRDAALDIWNLPAAEITKDIRFYAKNDWVFAQFYGSYYGNCAKSLWEDVIVTERLKTTSGLPLRTHMRDMGITKLYTFEEHCQDVERKFWNRLKVYKKWKIANNEFYRKYGYVDTFFGFRFFGPMTFNEVNNYPIQGTAFHILLWTLNRVFEVAEKEKWLTKPIIEIHDSMLLDMVVKEIKHVFKTIAHIATKETIKNFKWINVPMRIDAELSDIDGNWAAMREVEI